MEPDSSSIQVLWKEQVPRLSFQVPPLPSLAYLKNPVLLHALLCLSATYLKHMHPDTRVYDESILFHKHHALSLLQTKLDLINTSPTTNDAIFGTSTLLVIQALGEFSTSNSTTSPISNGFRL